TGGRDRLVEHEHALVIGGVEEWPAAQCERRLAVGSPGHGNRTSEARPVILRPPEDDVAATLAVDHVDVGRLAGVGEQPRSVRLIEAVRRGKRGRTLPAPTCAGTEHLDSGIGPLTLVGWGESGGGW